ncbi:MAG: hypothetical protein AAB468_01955 [Patescibacteria group bacterium]
MNRYITALLLGFLAFLSQGCGNVPAGSEEEQAEKIRLIPANKAASDLMDEATAAGEEISPEVTLAPDVSLPPEVPQFHRINFGTATNALRGYGNANVHGDTIVIEDIHSYVEVWPNTYPEEPGIGHFCINMNIGGSFIPLDGSVNETMLKLENLSSSISGNESITDFEFVPPPNPLPADCTPDMWYSPSTGLPCRELIESFPALRLNWNGYARLDHWEWPQPDGQLMVRWQSNASLNGNVNGGTITSANAGFNERRWSDEDQEPPTGDKLWYVGWDGWMQLCGFITGEFDTENPVVDTPGGGSSSGG